MLLLLILETYDSCEETLKNRPLSGNGIYKLKSGKHYCFMESISACGGAGWTVAMKINGNKASIPTRPYNQSVIDQSRMNHSLKLSVNQSGI